MAIYASHVHLVRRCRGTVLSPPSVPSKPSLAVGFKVRHLLSADKLPSRGHLLLGLRSGVQKAAMPLTDPPSAYRQGALRPHLCIAAMALVGQEGKIQTRAKAAHGPNVLLQHGYIPALRPSFKRLFSSLRAFYRLCESVRLFPAFPFRLVLCRVSFVLFWHSSHLSTRVARVPLGLARPVVHLRQGLQLLQARLQAKYVVTCPDSECGLGHSTSSMT